MSKAYYTYDGSDDAERLGLPDAELNIQADMTIDWFYYIRINGQHVQCPRVGWGNPDRGVPDDVLFEVVHALNGS